MREAIGVGFLAHFIGMFLCTYFDFLVCRGLLRGGLSSRDTVIQAVTRGLLRAKWVVKVSVVEGSFRRLWYVDVRPIRRLYLIVFC